MIKGLLVAASNEEARYVIRILQGTLRIGVLEKTLIAALAKAICFTPSLLFNEAKEKETASSLLQLSTSGQPTKETFEWAAQTLQRIFNEMTSYDVIIPALVENGLYALSHQSLLTPGVAVKPMLAQPTSGLQDLTKRFGESSCFVCEYKYDGERAHLHLTPDGKFFIFSRRCEDHTAKFPDVVQMLSSVKNETAVESCILDGEIVAYDRANNSLLPFQALTTRSRKDVRLESLTVHVCFYAFDLLYLNGKALIEESLETRRSLLEANFKAAEGHFQYVRSVLCSSEREAEQFLNEALAASCIEGIVAKLWSSEYALAKRAYHWLKVKRDYVDGMVETVDLVVMGGYHGHGKRVGVYGSYLLGVWDEDAEEYQTLCKCMTGYTDEFLVQSAAFFNDGQCLERAPSYYRYTSGNGNGGGSEPDQWFKPVKVWEIMSADITLSPVHKAAVGLVAESKGLSLRFPRFKREREDKAPEDATTAAQIARMYLAQQKR
ncbi:tRNA ligase, variant 2 [Balamuthia mandrillaris]